MLLTFDFIISEVFLDRQMKLKQIHSNLKKRKSAARDKMSLDESLVKAENFFIAIWKILFPIFSFLEICVLQTLSIASDPMSMRLVLRKLRAVCSAELDHLQVYAFHVAYATNLVGK